MEKQRNFEEGMEQENICGGAKTPLWYLKHHWYFPKIVTMER